MKRRIWFLIAIASVIAIAGAIFGAQKMILNGREAALQEQLQLARAEGLPTTWQEYAARLPKATAKENAAPLYSSLKPYLHGPSLPEIDSNDLRLNLLFRPTPQAEAQAAAILNKYQPALAIADQAATRPKVVFDKDWSLGIAVLFPEYPQVIRLAKLLSLRGTMAARRGDEAAAIADLHRILAIGAQVGRNPSGLSHRVGFRITAMGIEHLAYWSWTHRSSEKYRRNFGKPQKTLPSPIQKKNISVTCPTSLA